MTTRYDVALSYVQDYFSARVQELCAQSDLTFFLIEPVWVEEFNRKFQSGEVRVRVLIDMASDAYEPDEPYFKLAKSVKQAGGYIIDDPDAGAIMGHKALFHRMLVEHHIPVPETADSGNSIRIIHRRSMSYISAMALLKQIHRRELFHPWSPMA